MLLRRPVIQQASWYHSIDLGGGVITPGRIPLKTLQAQAEIYFRDGVEGQSVIDVGCWDGFNSFEAKRRGARRVLATDHVAWHTVPGARDRFEQARRALGGTVEAMDIDTYDINESTVGRFDVVLFLGVLYHLRHPFLGLEKVASICDKTLVVETHLSAWLNFRPAMIFYPTTELAGDPSNWWGPNRSCVTAMLHDLGFTPQFFRHPISPRRGIFVARRT
jgi:tRNA (mo5U34)-methyltransferase